MSETPKDCLEPIDKLMQKFEPMRQHIEAFGQQVQELQVKWEQTAFRLAEVMARAAAQFAMHDDSGSVPGPL